MFLAGTFRPAAHPFPLPLPPYPTLTGRASFLISSSKKPVCPARCAASRLPRNSSRATAPSKGRAIRALRHLTLQSPSIFDGDYRVKMIDGVSSLGQGFGSKVPAPQCGSKVPAPQSESQTTSPKTLARAPRRTIRGVGHLERIPESLSHPQPMNPDS